MQFSANTLKIGGLIRMPDSTVNPLDFATIVDKTQYGIYVVWKSSGKEERTYVSYGWLNYKYGTIEESDFNDPIPDMC